MKDKWSQGLEFCNFRKNTILQSNGFENLDFTYTKSAQINYNTRKIHTKSGAISVVQGVEYPNGTYKGRRNELL